MNEIPGIASSHRLTSQVKVSLESTQKPLSAEASSLTHEIEKFETEMQQLNYAFSLVKEIRHSLESALDKLS
jgi:hypothetical protein